MDNAYLAWTRASSGSDVENLSQVPQFETAVVVGDNDKHFKLVINCEDGVLFPRETFLISVLNYFTTCMTFRYWVKPSKKCAGAEHSRRFSFFKHLSHKTRNQGTDSKNIPQRTTGKRRLSRAVCLGRHARTGRWSAGEVSLLISANLFFDTVLPKSIFCHEIENTKIALVGVINEVVMEWERVALEAL